MKRKLLSETIGVAIGNGVYFAVKASYSASDGYSKPNAQRHKFMYYARVLVGQCTTGAGGMLVPPVNPNTQDQFDSVSDNPANPVMFVIFYDTQAYPEYLIEFT